MKLLVWNMAGNRETRQSEMNSDQVSVALTLEERDFLMSLMMFRPPADSEDGTIVGNDAIKEIPAAEYRRLWTRIDNKFRDAGTA